MLVLKINLAVRYVSDNELKLFCETLLASDRNNVAKHITLNLQGKNKYGVEKDLSSEKLLNVAKAAYEPVTIAKILPLFDNYDPDTTHNEDVTAVEKQEESALLDALLSTEVMKQAKSLLQSKELAPQGDKEFRKFISDIWFTIFSRGGRKMGSSAFEHIFLGELKKGDVSGLHNWIFFDQEEKTGRINYFGWTKKFDLPNGKGTILKVKYSWKNNPKPAGTMFVGTSPEFEMALYTVCFLARPNDRCNLAVGNKSFFVQTYSFIQNNKTLIGSAYPGI